MSFEIETRGKHATEEFLQKILDNSELPAHTSKLLYHVPHPW